MKLIERLKNGTLASSAIARLKRNYVLSEKNVFHKQERLLRILLNEARTHVPYYCDLLGRHKRVVLTDFPVMDRKTIAKDFDLFCNDRLEHFIYSDAYTGGSTGEPFHFLRVGGYENQFGLRKWEAYGYRPGEKILAMDGGKLDESDVKKGIYWYWKSDEDIPFGSWGLSSLYLTKDNARRYCAYINEFQPAFLRGYPAFVYALACYAEEFGVSFFAGIRGIELTSETAHPYQIEKIKEAFHAPVYLQYGHSEAIVFAYTVDETYRYRVEPLYGFVEVLDENGTHVKEGEVGEVVVTTLHNYPFPLIRYKTGDFAQYGGRDERYLYLDSVLGRMQDYIFDRNGDRVLLTALIFGQHWQALGNIVKWQLEQFEPGVVEIHVVRGKSYSQRDEDEIAQQFLLLGNVDTKFRYVESIPLTPRGKSSMLIQHIKNSW